MSEQSLLLSNTKYRYIRMLINSVRGNGSQFQISDIRFKNLKGEYFTYPSGTTVDSTMALANQTETPANLIDNNVSTKFYTRDFHAGDTITIDLKNNPIDVSEWICWEWWTANDSVDRDPTSFELAFSNDNSNFETVDKITGMNPTETRNVLGYSKVFYVGLTENKYRYIRFRFDRVRENNFQIADVRFVDNSGNFYNYPSTKNVTTNMEIPVSAEPPINVTDNDVNTKYYTTTYGANCYIQIDLGEGNEINLNQYKKWQWYTANDSQGRDPITFSILFSNDGENWECGDSVCDVNITTDRLVLAYESEIYASSFGNIKVKINNEWKDVVSIFTKLGAWSSISNAKVNIGGQWK